MSGARRFATTWLYVFGGVLSANIVSAQTEAIHLDYRADEGCPDAAWFFAQVEQRTTRARLAPPHERGRKFVVTLTRRGAGAAGRLAIQESQRGTMAREVAGESCRDVAAALAFATALAIDPQAAIAPARGGDGTASETGPSAPNSTSDPSTPSPSAAEPSARTSPPPTSAVASTPSASAGDATQDRASETRAASVWVWRAGASVALASGLAPRVSLGGLGFVGRETDVAGAIVSAVRVSAFALQAPDQAVESALASFRFLFVRPELCSVQLRVGSFAAAPCFAIDLGLVSATGSRIETPRDDDRLWAAAVIEGRLRYALSRIWFLQADLSLVLPFTRHRYYFRDPDTPIHAIPPLVGMGSAGFGAQFH